MGHTLNTPILPPKILALLRTIRQKEPDEATSGAILHHVENCRECWAKASKLLDASFPGEKV